MSAEENPYLDTTFEDHFRGAPQEVRRRLSVYLPLLEEAGVRGLGGEILDIGFGRGEWLEMLGAHRYQAVGVDLDESVVGAGLQAGLDVSAGDALEALRARPSESVAAVTAFHVIEHVDPSSLGELMREIHRVVMPGGVVILETPNPENVTVGAASFYIDPEHERPVPPPLLDFFARKAGFTLPWIARVNRACLATPLAEAPQDVPGALQINAAIYAINGMLFAAPDYALVAQKGGGPGPELDLTDYERIFGPQPLGLQSYRVLAAEEAAHKLQAGNLELQAQNLEVQERSAQLQRELAAAGARASEAESRGNAAVADMATVSGSLSWRVTAPLRAVSAVMRGPTGTPAVGRGGSPKRYATLAVGYSMRWALSQPRLGPALDRQFVKVPFVDHKVRIAIHEVTTGRVTHSASDELPPDIAVMPEHARGVFADLRKSLEDRG